MIGSLSAVAVFVMMAAPAAAASDPPATGANPLRAASGTIESLVGRVAPSVVQIAATGYHPITLADGSPALSRGRSIGSGVVIDANGYILTNAHVVTGAERIEILFGDATATESTFSSANGRSVAAQIVGVAADLDLALLSVPLKHLQALPLAEPGTIRQGELVFAFGSPDGLRNSVSMGMVSSVGRQADPNSALPYVQTDAAINPGNSGGPLVDMSGRLVGINTFIRTASGGSEGLGFAIPSPVVALAVPQLREFGHLHRAVTGLMVQNVTPLLKAGLGLAVDAGLLVSDLLRDGPAEAAGARVGDVITAIDDRPVAALTMSDFYLSLLALGDRQAVALTISRGRDTLTLHLTAIALPHICERDAALFDARSNLIEPLGVLAAPVPADATDADGNHPRAGGVVVTARLDTPPAADANLNQGDVIHSVNGTDVNTVAEVRARLTAIASGEAIVLQVERNGQLTYVGFERD
jgi:serine protease Do